MYEIPELFGKQTQSKVCYYIQDFQAVALDVQVADGRHLLCNPDLLDVVDFSFKTPCIPFLL